MVPKPGVAGLRSCKAEITPHGQLAGGSREEATLVRTLGQVGHLKASLYLCQPGHS